VAEVAWQLNASDLIGKEKVWDYILDDRTLILFWRSPFVQYYEPIYWPSKCQQKLGEFRRKKEALFTLMLDVG